MLFRSNLPSDHLKKQIIELIPNVLIYSNQNIRYSLLFYPEFIEVLNNESVKDKTIRNNIKNNSNNSFIVNKKIFDHISRKELVEAIDQAKTDFYAMFNSTEKKQKLKNHIREITHKMDICEENSDYIINNILYKTYRLDFSV